MCDRNAGVPLLLEAQLAAERAFLDRLDGDDFPAAENGIAEGLARAVEILEPCRPAGLTRSRHADAVVAERERSAAAHRAALARARAALR